MYILRRACTQGQLELGDKMEDDRIETEDSRN